MRESARAAARWWREIVHLAPQKDNGDAQQSALGSMAAAMVASDNPVTAEMLDRFEEALAESTDRKLNEHATCRLGVDYNPCRALYDACVASGINADMTGPLPWKTNMTVERNKVSVSHGYGAPWRVIYEQPGA